MLERSPLIPVETGWPASAREQRDVSLRWIKCGGLGVRPGMSHHSRNRKCRNAIEPKGNLGNRETAIEPAMVLAHIGRVEVLVEGTVGKIGAARVAEISPPHGGSL